MQVSEKAIEDILWWKHNIIGVYEPIVKKKIICCNEYWRFIIRVSLGQYKTGGQFATEKKSTKH